MTKVHGPSTPSISKPGASGLARGAPTHPQGSASFGARLAKTGDEPALDRSAGPLSAKPHPMHKAHAAGQTAAAPEASPLGHAKKFVARILNDENAVDKGLAQALRGKAFSPQELIVLQANVIKYSQELEMASKMIEKLTSAVKQTMQTQV